MTTTYRFEQDVISVRDFILEALARDKCLWSNEFGYAASDSYNEEIEGEWREVLQSEALSLCGYATDGAQWEKRRHSDGSPYFRYGHNDLNSLWLEDENWVTDADGNTAELTRHPNIGAAADFLEERAREIALAV